VIAQIDSAIFGVHHSASSVRQYRVTEAHSAFAAQAFHPSLGNEVAAGSLTFDRWRLRFEAEGLTLDIPLDRLRIEVESRRVKRICFSDPEQPEWSVCTLDRNILREVHLQGNSSTRNQIRAIRNRGELKRALILTLGFAAGFAVVAFLVSLLVGAMVRSLVGRVPASWEQQLGDDEMKELHKHLTFVEDPKRMAKLDRAVAPLVGSLSRPGLELRFHLVEHPLPNACALPGGNVVVTTDLIDLADRPEEIAGVVAHEVAHVTQKHGLRKIISSTGPYLIFRMFMSDGRGLLGALGDGSQLLVRQSFSQQYEFEADAVGFDYLVAAHVDPRGLTEMLRKLKAVQESGFGVPPQLQAFSTHPATEKRIQRLEAKWEKLPDKSGFIDYDEAKPGL
jgi:Zn-dependent protease with chaperone function